MRIGVIGVGVRAVLATWTGRSEVDAAVVAAADPTEAGRGRARELFGKAVQTYATHTELLASRPSLDAVFVTSPDSTHAAITVDALEAGVAVYLEKPLAITLDDADAILAAALRTGTKLYVGHNMRHMAVVRQMRELIDDGRIGEVQAVWCRHFVGHGGDFYFKDWHADRRHSTGLLLQKGAHDIDVIHYLSGGTSIRVTAMGALKIYGGVTARRDNSDRLMEDWLDPGNWPPRSQRDLNPVIDVEDLSMMLMQLDNGVLASYQQCHFTPDYWRNYTVIGDRGRMENFGDGDGGLIRIWDRRGDYDPDGDDVYRIEGDRDGHDDADRLAVDEFLRFVARGVATTTSPLAARDAVAAGLAATESLRNGSVPVEVRPADPEVARYLAAHQPPAGRRRSE
ncbi:Gfo/Idh/MocA family oxidoreductase [Microtetraspora sp. NBRC 16547]|uniref:Gfo/Idh/MocA family protein n=1 Tax=Microtetraspora sp. NBRC 16547 TaxID=3030993 RepID=UPI0024A2F43A|nr:Gfo/Idh/MocA family oxidoreductase [Microtetraspora sp. NBRC 16547]GLX00445.1 oxidoreductase [Microtetraspora sp. NBRC 16547]